MSESIFQEMYCHECGYYNRLRLLSGYDRVVTYKCAHCDHEHQRCVKNGRITEDGRYSNGGPVEEIVVLKSQCSKEPLHARFLSQKSYPSRSAHVFEKDEDYAGFSKKDTDAMAQQILNERKLELYTEGGAP